MVRVVAHCLGAQDTARSVLETLAARKIEAGTANDGNGPHLVFFDECSDLLLQRVRELSVCARDRILLIAAPVTALAPAQKWKLLTNGASNVFSDTSAERLCATLYDQLERWSEIDAIFASPLVSRNLIGCSSTWRSELRRIIEVAKFTEANVLLCGETGTGKELLARLIHSLSARPNKGQMVVLDCTTVVRELSGSELFGHERGAYTGAVGPRDGAFALADGGTLFLDEIGELPLALQAQLLRAIQEKTYKRVGGNQWCRSDFRLVCATNRDLLKAVERGEFRRDLYYRIAGWVAKPPALRERPEDIVPLAKHFLEILRPGAPVPEFEEAVQQYLVQREYPGNVRDLRQLVSRIAYRHVGPGPITPGDIPEEERPTTERDSGCWCDEGFRSAVRHAVVSGVGLKEISRVTSDTAVQIALRNEGGSIGRAARRLRVTDRALQMRQADRRVSMTGEQ
jgi:transcriptional regulator with GAF, ATPase, and Fis domain